MSEDQRLQLSTPSYRLKKEKRDLKKSADTPNKDSSSSSLIDPSSVMVVGVVDDQGIVKSPGSSSDKKKKNNQPDKPHSSKDSKTSADKPSKSLTNTHRSSPDTRIEELDQKWSERFNRLEALLLSKSLDKEPTFSSVKVTPAHSPPQSSAISSRPFIEPGQIQVSWLPTSPLRGRSPTKQRIPLLLNDPQICLVLFRLSPSRPANCQKERCLPTKIQM